VKNRQYNFPPFGLNPFVNAQARPNEVTYSEPSMRPDYVPAPTPSVAATAPATVSTAETGPTDLQGMLLPAERHP
jgi:phospholipid/cholesterol/gamma-HCH transport system substrate-binding protein